MEHHFDIEIAKKYGISEAILLYNINFWVMKNEANGVNYYDGSYWTYSSVKAFNELFPYLSPRKIQNALKHLKDEGIIKTGNYNKSKYDRTLWYAITDLGKSIVQKSKMENYEKKNGNIEKVEPIPNNKNKDIKPDNKQDNIYNSEFEKIWKSYPRKLGKEKALNAYKKARQKGVTYEEIEQGVLNYKGYIILNHIKPEYIKHGSTWFNQECWKDDYTVSREVTTADFANKFDFSEFRL